MEEIIVYTAITGNKDQPRIDILNFGEYDKFKQYVMNAKIYKVLAHQYLDCKYSIWVDGNIILKVPKEKIIEEFLGDNDIAVWKHFARDCIYEESKAIRDYKPNIYQDVEKQVNYYKSKGFPEHYGLGECNVIVRRHTPIVEKFNNYWWSEICRWSSRDQISFPYVISRLPELKVKFVMGDPRKHPYFEYHGHTIS